MKKEKPKSYSDFTLTDLSEMFGIINRKQTILFENREVIPPKWLEEVLSIHKFLPQATEKAKSELLITPILSAFFSLNKDKCKYFSGYNFDVDIEKSLKGRCDFLFSTSISSEIQSTVFAIFEAKDDSLEHWYGQCGAEMYASQLFNQKNKADFSVIYGAVSNGLNWQFLKLENQTLIIDTEYYTLQNLPLLLGILQQILDFYTN